MAYKVKRKKKKKYKSKKFTLQLSPKQYELLKYYSSYTNQAPGMVLKKAVKVYLKQVSYDIEHWKKINPGQHIMCEEERSRQMEIGF
jgi:hypothetical protein